MTDLQEVLKCLPKLSKAELDQVRQRVAFLAGCEETRSVRGEDWLAAGFLSELQRRGLASIRTANRKVLKYIVPKDYAEQAAAVREHLLSGVNSQRLVYPEQLALGKLAAVVLLAYLSRAKVPLTPKTLFSNVNKVPEALEASFPGYWQARALGICLHREA